MGAARGARVRRRPLHGRCEGVHHRAIRQQIYLESNGVACLVNQRYHRRSVRAGLDEDGGTAADACRALTGTAARSSIPANNTTRLFMLHGMSARANDDDAPKL